MKDIEHLRRLANNPFYVMSVEDKQLLEELENNKSTSKVTETKARKGFNPAKVQEAEATTSQKKLHKGKGNAVVKEIGKLNKHSTDPITE